MALAQATKSRETTYTLDDAMDILLTKLDDAIDDMENGRVWRLEEAWKVHESKLPGDPCGLTTKPIEGTMLLPGRYVAEGYDLYMEPCLDLHADKTATLTYSSYSSDIPMGEITIEDGSLILNDDMFEKKYTFLIDGADLIFQADRSAEIPQLDENTLKDGARFVYQEEK